MMSSKHSRPIFPICSQQQHHHLSLPLLSPSGPAWCRGRSLRFCRDPQKLLRVRVCFRRHASALCVFLRALISYQAHTWHSAFFSVKHARFLSRGKTRYLRSKSYSGRRSIRRGVSGCNSSAGKPLWGECALWYFFVVCCNFRAAAAASLRVRLKFWDIWHISHFPAAALLIQSLPCSAGSSCVIRSLLLCCILLRLFRRPPDLVWSLLRYY